MDGWMDMCNEQSIQPITIVVLISPKEGTFQFVPATSLLLCYSVLRLFNEQSLSSWFRKGLFNGHLKYWISFNPTEGDFFLRPLMTSVHSADRLSSLDSPVLCRIWKEISPGVSQFSNARPTPKAQKNQGSSAGIIYFSL